MLSAFPTVDYKFSDGKHRQIVNFTAAILVEQMNLRNQIIFKPYTVYDTDTPEVISQELYDTPAYWWTILLVNEVINPFTGWIRPSGRIKRESEKDNVILHFIDTRTDDIVDDIDDRHFRDMVAQDKPLPEYINAVRRYDYEKAKTDKMAEVWVISPDYIHEFVEEYATLLRQTGYR